MMSRKSIYFSEENEKLFERIRVYLNDQMYKSDALSQTNIIMMCMTVFDELFIQQGKRDFSNQLLFLKNQLSIDKNIGTQCPSIHGEQHLNEIQKQLTYLQNQVDCIYYLCQEGILEKDETWQLSYLREASANGMDDRQKILLEKISDLRKREITTRKIMKHNRQK